MKRARFWLLLTVLPWVLLPIAKTEERVSDYPYSYTVDETPEPGSCTVWLNAADMSTQAMETDKGPCHSWKKGELVHARSSKAADILYLLVYGEDNKAQKIRVKVLQVVDRRPLTVQFPVTFSVQASFVSGDQCFMSVTDGQFDYDVVDRTEGQACFIIKPGGKVRGRFEVNAANVNFIRLATDDGKQCLYMINTKRFAQ